MIEQDYVTDKLKTIIMKNFKKVLIFLKFILIFLFLD